MKSLYVVLTLIVVAFLTFSCDEKGSVNMKSISGKPGEMVIVVSKQQWEGEPGALMRGFLAQQHLSLPADEPVFDLVNVPHEGFKSILQSTRNILHTSISENVEKEGIEFRDNVWAYPQSTVYIMAKNAVSFVKIFTENQEKIMSYFLNSERKRLINTYSRLHQTDIYNALSNKFGITLTLAPGFIKAAEKENLMWFRFDARDVVQGVVVFSTPYSSDSAFTVGYQVNLLDSILKANVEGSVKNSFMQVERRVDQVFNILRHNTNYASEIRGLWTMKNDFMGGPYIALSELDLLNNRIVTAYGFVYAPSKEKRNLLRQVEAMLYTMKFGKQADMDKLNKQMRFGE